MLSTVQTQRRNREFGPGAVVGSYTVRHELGRGSGGVVYLADDARLNRAVALKVLETQWSSQDDLRNFMEEARTTARFNHPHIVTLYAADLHDGTPYLALEYVDGQTLRQRMERGPLRESEVMQAAREIALALNEAHEAGLIHADLKPENVMVTKEGRHKVMDFGLARAVGGERPIASGTPAYMAPERWTGAKPSMPMDVWALGAMVFEMMEGRRPLPDQELQTQPTPPIVLPPRSADAPFAEILRRMLDPEPARRPSIHEVALAMADQPRSAEGSVRPPFRGLRAYELSEASDFMGREGDIDQALVELRRERALLLVGPSGVGKTSFIRAGLIPRLRDDLALRLVEMRPGARPTASLVQALSRSLELRASDTFLDTRTALLLAHQARLKTNRVQVLVVDQLEELFTLAEQQEVDAFARALAALVDEAEVYVILAVRDDFLGRLTAVRDLERYLRRVQVLRPLAPRTLATIIHQSLRRVGYTTDTPGLINQIVSDVSAQPTPLPLMQFVCEQLWERRDRQALVIRAEEYDALGRAAGALAAHGDRVLAGLTAAQVARVRRIMVRLVNPDGTRRPRTWRELTEGSEDAASLLQLLVDNRLLSTSRLADTDETAVELAHEALATLWTTLVGWLTETTDSRRQLDEVEAAARGWVARGRREDETWSQSTVEETDRRLDSLRGSLSTGVP